MQSDNQAYEKIVSSYYEAKNLGEYLELLSKSYHDDEMKRYGESKISQRYLNAEKFFEGALKDIELGSLQIIRVEVISSTKVIVHVNAEIVRKGETNVNSTLFPLIFERGHWLIAMAPLPDSPSALLNIRKRMQDIGN
ncbi:hypothetical protein MNBD_GAMMA13-953 [hydrothermal vent metagenome]|uniref:Nuclear transport factor 2 family protein n=1 Tax=hydrothermal vent metagenome TaxID=652676 RepID=A0A3B0ZAG8_9ZZZZ